MLSTLLDTIPNETLITISIGSIIAVLGGIGHTVWVASRISTTVRHMDAQFTKFQAEVVERIDHAQDDLNHLHERVARAETLLEMDRRR